MEQELSKIEEEALKLILENTYKEQVVKDSLSVLEDIDNVKYITRFGYSTYSSTGVEMFQGKILKNILRILTVEKLESNDILKKYQLGGYIKARQLFKENNYSVKRYHESAYFKTDKYTALKTLFKHDKKIFFTYHFNKNKHYLIGGAIVGLGLLALKRF